MVKLAPNYIMKLIAIRDQANVPSIGITVDPKSRGFKHPKHIHKGYRFNFGSVDTFDGLTQDEKNTVGLLLHSKAVVIDDDSPASKAAIAKIEAEIAEDKEREKRDTKRMKEPWTRAHKLQILGMGIALVIACSGWYHAAHQSPVYQKQIILKHDTEVLARHFAEIAIGFDADSEAKGDFFVHDLPWLKSVTDDLQKQGLDTSSVVNIYNDSQKSGKGVTSEVLNKIADALNSLAKQLPTSQ
jgi:hypothetical protein